jgi:hypothetical protein
MLTISQAWLVIVALATLIPDVVNAVRNGKIVDGAQDEVLSALSERWDARIAAANAAKPAENEDVDPYNRTK